MKTAKKRIIVLAVFTAFISAVVFLPGLISAGDLEPPGAPGSTMKSLDELPPAWNQILTDSERFVPALDGSARLDKETGLVWERVVSTNAMNWYNAAYSCYIRVVDLHGGWRLPTVDELHTLRDRSQTSAPYIPSGLSVINLKSAESDAYWTMTTAPDLVSDTSVFVVRFGDSSVPVGADLKTGTNYHWCVRGGH